MNVNGHSDFRLQSFIVMLIFSMLSLNLIGVIPINEGAGWDGAVYRDLIVAWTNGQLGVADLPYRLMRSGSFLPQVFLHKVLGIPLSDLIIFSRWIAVAWVALGGWFTLLACYRLGIIKNKTHQMGALLLFACYLTSYTVFTLPAFYPLLSDHVALFFTGFALWIWTFQNQKYYFKEIGLGLLAAWGFFVMPLISIIPMTLLICPVISQSSSLEKHCTPFIKNYYRSILLIFSIISITIGVLFMLFMPLTITNEVLVMRPNGTSSALVDLKIYSAILSILMISWALLLLFVCSLHLLFKFSWRLGIFSIVCIIPSLIILYCVPTWDNGMHGPNLLYNLSIQALQAPGSQMAALFACLGPIGFLGLFALSVVILKNQANSFNSVGFSGAFFLLFLSIGNETRQFVCILPILLFYAICLFKSKLMICIVSLAFTVFLLSIGWPIADNTHLAMNNNLDFLSTPWQSYFGRTGPWMSTESRLLFSSIFIFYLITLLLLNFITVKDK